MRFSIPQTQAIEMRDKNILVSASAGSGKTSVLVERLCQLVLKDKISIDSILAMTFTDDAASEMKGRLKMRLQQEKQTEWTVSQLALLETADICTIDSFCFSLVKTYYYQIPISYTMSRQVADQAQANEAFLQAYQSAQEHLDPEKLKSLYMFIVAYGKKEEDLLSYVQSCINIAWAKPDPETWLEECTKSNNERIIPWFMAYFKERIQAMIEILDDLTNQLEDPEIYIQKRDVLSNLLEIKDYPSFKQGFKAYFLSTPAFKKTIEKIDFGNLQKEFKDLEAQIANNLFDFDFETENPLIKTFTDLVIYTKHAFDKQKANMEIIDFSDMEHFAYKLLQNPMIKEEVQAKYNMILVDEFQDTNDLQESIISCFARKNNVFRVGDIKQSIYGFRQAKPDIMLGHMQKEDEYSTTLILDENYRSNRSIIDFNNDFYEKIMNTEYLGQAFFDRDKAKTGTKSQSECEQFPIRFLYTEYGTWKELHEEYNLIEAKAMHNAYRFDLIAKDILKKHKQGVAYKDICILTRSHGPQEEIKDVLELYGIPSLAEIDHGFYTNAAIQIILSTLRALIDPNDDIALMSALVSPLFNITHEQITKACLDKSRYDHLFTHLKNSEFLKPFVTLYTQEKKDICSLIRQLYMLNDFYTSHTTRKDKTNLDYFLELASNYENAYDLSGFVDRAKKASDQDAISEADPYGKESDVVKIKTMHHSKGLQFPIVYILSKSSTKDMNAGHPILIDADLGISFSDLDPSFKIKQISYRHLAFLTKMFHDELKEEMRVFYVATTRPQKELIIVDSIKSMKEFEYPLNTRAFLKKRSYTSWLLHTYCQDIDKPIQFEIEMNLTERPTKRSTTKKSQEIKVYTKESTSIQSQTASNAKRNYSYDSIRLEKNFGTIRGTIFHEMAEKLSYPYQEKDIQAYLKDLNVSLSPTDLKQFLSLNDEPLYQDFMANHHKFELSYLIKEKDELRHGFMDLVVFKDKEIRVLDFKTDTVNRNSDLISKYRPQLKMYKEALEQIYPGLLVKAYIYSFHLQEMFEVPVS